MCRSVDSKLKLLLEDMTYYTGSEEVVTSQEAGPFDRFADRLALQQFVQNTCAEHIARYIFYRAPSWHTWVYTLHMLAFVHVAAKSYFVLVSRLISHLQKHLYASKQQLTNSDDVIGNKTVIDRWILGVGQKNKNLLLFAVYVQHSDVITTLSKLRVYHFRMLLLARFTSALCELSPCLQKCVVFTREVKSDL